MSGPSCRLVFGVSSSEERQLELELVNELGEIVWCEIASGFELKPTSCPVGTVFEITSRTTLATLDRLFTSTGVDERAGDVSRME